ncbi:uncharacterized protein C8Q71DRAFT_339743 [Rhodofomes roseus]|uniref:Uncharacterized protein n=1 Tax=Rhodofomes roseus TaxID=34475 RepID=A0ABQ8KSS5_9APHY|nr:uncharacterized protein C8Q71DRAFT_339743 [Rhodofomes roseus]KAH9841594.1 hypothetical protein C8Q71DRAFT_339743 [Rhodofomes roseus]
MVLAAIHGYTGGHCGVDHHAVSRHDICSSRMNKYQLSLFIQALQRMTDFNIPRQLFCANVANTRGLPCGTAGGCALPKMKKNGNYVHDVEPCPSERRPSSCAFIEHEICRHAHDIALQYSTDKACWKQAARDLCLPCLASTRCDPCELPVELSSYAVTILVPCYNKTVERLVVNPLFCGIAHDQGPRNISAILKDWFPCIDPASITYNISNDR